jgi:dolichol-phosphate mannosyltransferase
MNAEHPATPAGPRLLSVVCPAYREEETIATFHAALVAGLGPLRPRYRFEILYVVDPSDDGTERALAAIAAESSEVGVLVMSRRFGHQAALMAGIEQSAGEAVVMLDSDLQHPPELIPELVARYEAGADIVQTLRKEDVTLPWFKRTTSRWFYDVLMRVGSIELPPGAADYRLVSARVARLLRDELPERDPFLRGLFVWVGFDVSYLPYTPAQRAAGRSKYSTRRLLAFALNGIFSFSKVPLRLCILAGIAIALLSVVFTAVYVAVYVLGNQAVPGWASLFGAIGFIGGIQLLFLGIIGEYVGIVFDEVKRRPRYVIARRIGRLSAHAQDMELPRVSAGTRK